MCLKNAPGRIYASCRVAVTSEKRGNGEAMGWGAEGGNSAINCFRKINNKNILDTGSCSPAHCTPSHLTIGLLRFLSGAGGHCDPASPRLSPVPTISLTASSQRVRGHTLPTFVFHSTQSHMEHIGGSFHFIKPRGPREYGICNSFF